MMLVNLENGNRCLTIQEDKRHLIYEPFGFHVSETQFMPCSPRLHFPMQIYIILHNIEFGCRSHCRQCFSRAHT